MGVRLIDRFRARLGESDGQLYRLLNSQLAAKLASGTFWSLIGAVVSRGFTFVASVVAARMLGVVAFGELGMVQSTLAMLSSLAGFSMGLLATKFVAEYQASDPDKVSRVLHLSNVMSWASGLVLAAALVAGAPWLAARTMSAPHLAPMLRIASLLLALGSVTGAQTGALYGFSAFRTVARINVVTGLATFFGVVAGTRFMGVAGALWGFVASQAVTTLVNHLAIRGLCRRHGIPSRAPGWTQETRLIWSFCLPSVLGGLMIGPVLWASNAFLVNQPNGYREMGLFSAANQVRQAILFLPTTLASVALPMLASLQQSGSREKYLKVFWANLALCGLAAAAVALPAAAFAPWIMARFGGTFHSGALALILLAVVSVLMATLNIVGQSIVSEGRMWSGFTLNLIWAVVLLISSYMLRREGAVGLSWANLIAYGVHLFTSCVYVRGRLKRWRESPTSQNS